MDEDKKVLVGGTDKATLGADASSDFAAAASGDLERLRAQVRSLQHRALRDRDSLVGLQGEVETLKARIESASESDLWLALARIDRLEEERDRLNTVIHNTRIESREAIESMRATTTWRLGSLLTKPLAKLKAIGRRS